MNEEARVNHPSYYETPVEDGRDHPECIDLLEVLTSGLPGILALDIGQLKYLYRFGKKDEEGLSRKEKALEDVNKIEWYAKDFKRHWGYYCNDVRPPVSYSQIANRTIQRLIAEEFAFDKPESLKPYVRNVIYIAYDLSVTASSNVDAYIEAIQHLIKAIEDTKEEEWN